MRNVRTISILAVLVLGLSGSLTPAAAQVGGLSFIIKISAEPSIGGTAIGAATGSINGSSFSIPETSWTKTHSQKAPLFEGGVAIGAGHAVDVVALVNYGHVGANSAQVGQLGGVPVTAALDNYTFWGVEGGVHVRGASGVGPYATVTAGFRRVSEIKAGLTTATLAQSVTVYNASVVPTFAFGGGMLFGDRAFAIGFEIAVRYAGAPSGPSSQNLPTLPSSVILTPASGAGARWSLPVGVVLKF